MNNSKNKIIIALAVFALFIAATGISYAYFLSTIEIKNQKNNVVSTGTLSLNYVDGNAINGVNIKPGWTETKTITVENTGTLAATYTLKWKNLTNQITKSEMVLSLTCTTTSSTSCASNNLSNVAVATSAGNIKSGIAIAPGEKQTLKVTFLFKNLSESQNYNQGKKFNGVLNIAEG